VCDVRPCTYYIQLTWRRDKVIDGTDWVLKYFLGDKRLIFRDFCTQLLFQITFIMNSSAGVRSSPGESMLSLYAEEILASGEKGRINVGEFLYTEISSALIEPTCKLTCMTRR